MNERNFNAVPKAACMLAVGSVEMGSNGENAKSAPIKLKARSGDSIEHWYWGKVIHDLAGMRVNKPRLTIDYAHNDNEILGYLNHFDTAGGDLIASGALTPWREDDRASEVMFKMAQGVPYEASIFFGGDGIKIEEVAEGMMQTVNGRQFDGPGVIIREWPLRGVAICPYGADANTETSALAQGETVAVQTVTPTKGSKMSDEQQTVEAEAEAEGVVPVEAAAVEAEAAPETDKPEVNLSAQTDMAVDRLAALTVERDALAVERDALKAEGEKAVEALSQAITQRDELAAKFAKAEAELTALRAERDEACRKLSAIEAGAPPLSAMHAPEIPAESAWKKAQKTSPSKRA
jgi:hypothetical protein